MFISVHATARCGCAAAEFERDDKNATWPDMGYPVNNKLSLACWGPSGPPDEYRGLTRGTLAGQGPCGLMGVPMGLPGGSLGLTGGPRGLTEGPLGVTTETSGLTGGPPT